jgi:hypothetical protein
LFQKVESSEYIEAHGELEVAGIHFEAELSTVLGDPEYYNSFIKVLDDDKFVYKIQYNQAREYLVQLKAKQKSSDASLLDLL